jgi:hypothetical protein
VESNKQQQPPEGHQRIKVSGVWTIGWPSWRARQNSGEIEIHIIFALDNSPSYFSSFSFPNSQSISLYNDIGPVGMEKLAEAIQINQTITKIE